MDNNIEIGKTYKHYKGNVYKVLHIAIHTETVEEMVVYQATYDDMKIFVRPLKMFLEKVEVNNKLVNRFEKYI